MRGFLASLGILCFVALIIVWIVMISAWITYEQGCGGYLKRAADSTSISKAITALETAIQYMEGNNLTSGYTSIFWKTPGGDIGFWHDNIKEAVEQLKDVPENVTRLEETNILMKLRETLVDQGQSTEVTAPGGISRYPHNALFMWLQILLPVAGILLIWLPTQIENTSNRHYGRTFS